MTLLRRAMCALVAGLMLWAIAAVPVLAQGAPGAPGLANPNTVGESELLQLPGMTPAIVKSLTEQRPFKSIVELNKFLLDQKLTAAQAREFYRKAVRADQFEHGHTGRIHADPRRRLAYGGGICRIPAVEDLGAVRQGNRQICRPAGDRPLQAIRDPAGKLISAVLTSYRALRRHGRP
jgi:hypothetical protein